MTTAEIIGRINGRRIGELLSFDGKVFSLPEDCKFEIEDEPPGQLRASISKLCRFAESIAAHTSIENGVFSIDIDRIEISEDETVTKYLSQLDSDRFFAALVMWVKSDKHLNGWSIFRPLMVKILSASIGARGH